LVVSQTVKWIQEYVNGINATVGYDNSMMCLLIIQEVADKFQQSIFWDDMYH